jgi:hypothetical protein
MEPESSNLETSCDLACGTGASPSDVHPFIAPGRGGDLPDGLIFRNRVKPRRQKIFRFFRNKNRA